MLRKTPFWYHRHFDTVLCSFEDVFSQPIPQLYTLPAFMCPEMSPDGIHLTSQSGPRLILTSTLRLFSVICLTDFRFRTEPM
jgi:hypothetical protein